MRAVALVTPLLVLGLLPVLGRMEAWSVGERTRPRARTPRPRTTVRTRMTATTPPADPELVPGPLPRDPPPPPGYRDPLEDSPVLEDLVDPSRGEVGLGDEGAGSA
ncbi:hypothetical protein [Oryzobacter terrae]|uniref:hypothetical protein n=1 Tax=Oryzobacter terrae TaxID=1620385 RepID=UPI00366BF5B6